MYFHVAEAQAYTLDRATGEFRAVGSDPAAPAPVPRRPTTKV
jgi:hypothetical protein